MGLATIIAALAFFIALVALWLTSDVLKKAESQNEKFVRAHIKSVRDELKDMGSMLAKTNKALKALTDEQTSVDKRINDHTTAISAATDRLTQISVELDTLDRSIPKRYRQQTIAVAAPDGKPKPTVQ